MGYDPELGKGKIRLIEDPTEYIKEYLAKKIKNGELVKKGSAEDIKKNISPIIKRQLYAMKQSLKDNGLKMKDITEYLADDE